MEKKLYERIGEEVFRTTLPNGLPVYIVPKKGFLRKYALFATRYGGMDMRFEKDGQWLDTPAGIAHYLEHKMFDTEDGNALQELAKNGAEPNAFTSNAITCYYFDATDKFYESLEILLSFVSIPYFTDESVEKEQGIIAQEIRMGEDNPGMVVYYNLLGLLYDHHPIRDRVAGTVESISHITAQTLYDCHRVFYAPSNMVLCVEGCVDPETVARIAEEELPKERAEVPTADYGETESMLPRERLCRVQGEVSAPQFFIGAKLDCAERGEAALRQHLVAALCLRMLCGSSSPFYTRLYADGLLSVNFDYETDFSAGTGTVIIGGESREPEKILEELSREVERIAAEGFDAGSFERAKRASLGARLRGLEDFDNVCVSMAMGLLDGYCALDAFRLLESVTAEECRRFAAENLCRERLAMSIIEPKSAPTGTEETE